jgi:hypothetical protein
VADFPSRLTTWLETHRILLASILAFIVLTFSAYLLLYKLGKEPLQDYDEATYAEVTSESLASHDFRKRKPLRDFRLLCRELF